MSEYEFDVLVGADGKRNTLQGTQIHSNKFKLEGSNDNTFKIACLQLLNTSLHAFLC